MRKCNEPETDGLRLLWIDDAIHKKTPQTELENLIQVCFEVTTATSKVAMELTRRQVFDVAVVRHSLSLDACQFVPVLLEMGAENLAVIVLGDGPARELEPACLSAGADAYQCFEQTDETLMRWVLARSVQRRQLLGHAQRWDSQQTQRRQEDAAAGIHLVRALRGCLLDADTPAQPPAWLVGTFLDLLRTYVVSIAGDLNDDIAQLVDGLRDSGVTLCEALLAHSHATEQMLLGMGHRPGRRIQDRSQMLAYAVIARYQSYQAINALGDVRLVAGTTFGLSKS